MYGVGNWLKGSILQLLLWKVTAQIAIAKPAANLTAVFNASAVITPSFAGFGIESTHLFAYTGGSETNALSIKLLQNLADYAGEPGQIRVGGNTADYLVYDASYTDYATTGNPKSTGQGAIAWDSTIFGPKFFEVIDRFPQGTPIIFNLNLAYDAPDWASRIVTSANTTLDTLKNVKVIGFEVGNEPDLYHQNGFRSPAYSSIDYVAEWFERINVLWKQTLQPRNISSKFFEAACTVTVAGTGFEVDSLVEAGITQGQAGADTFLSGWNKHDYYYFINISSYSLTQDLFAQFDTTEGQFAFWRTESVAAQKSGLPYYLREMANVGPVGMEGISDIFSASIWTLNFFLYAATLNVTSVQMHMTFNSYASPWLPIPMFGQQPHVRPSYYAYAALNQIIGAANGTLRVATLGFSSIDTAYQSYVRGYSLYSNGTLTGVALLNSKLTNSAINVTLSLPEFANQKLYLQRLTAPNSTSTANVTWNGFSFEQTANGAPTNVSHTSESVDIGADGQVTFLLPDVQAIVATIGSPFPSIVELSSPTKKNDSIRSKGTALKAPVYAFILMTVLIMLCN